jgi:hypothetical protein
VMRFDSPPESIFSCHAVVKSPDNKNSLYKNSCLHLYFVIACQVTINWLSQLEILIVPLTRSLCNARKNNHNRLNCLANNRLAALKLRINLSQNFLSPLTSPNIIQLLDTKFQNMLALTMYIIRHSWLRRTQTNLDNKLNG